MKDLIRTKEAAEILGVTPDALRKWRTRKLFGCPFFPADELRGKIWYYDRERVEQLKAVYQPGTLSNMYKLVKESANIFLVEGRIVKSTVTTGRQTAIVTSQVHHGCFTLEDVAEIFSVTINVAKSWVERGTLRWDLYDHANRWLFKKETIEAFMERRKRKKINADTQPTPKSNTMISNLCKEDCTMIFHSAQATIDEVKKLSYDDRERLKEELLNCDPHVVFAPAGESSRGDVRKIICPICGNGSSGKNATPVEVHYKDGKWLYNCFRCGDFHGDLITIIADDLKLNRKDYDDFTKILAAGAEAIGYNFVSRTSKAATRKPVIVQPQHDADAQQIPLIKADIADAQAHLEDLPESDRRGLNLETFRHFGCGYLKDWTHPRCRVEGTKTYPTPRIIIPTEDGPHYNAVLPPSARTRADKQFWKMHAGTKDTPFNASALKDAADLVIVVEGEIDAMSIWQATKGKVAVVATLGAGSFNILLPLLNRNQKCVVLFDDDGGGQSNAKKIVDTLIKRGYPAVSLTFDAVITPEDKEIICADAKALDANQILMEAGEEFLKDALETIIDVADPDLVAVEEEIARNQDSADSAEEPAQVDDDMEQYLYGIKDLGNAQRMEKFCGKYIRWLYDSQRWLVWRKQGVWFKASDDNSVLTPHFNRFAAKMLKYKWKLVKKFDSLAKEMITQGADGRIQSVNEQVRKDYDDVKTRTSIVDNIVEDFHSSGKIAAACAMLKGIESILIWEKDLDTHTNLINCLNGVVDLQTGKLYPANPSLLITQQVNANYRPGYRNPEVDKFLRDILPDEATLAAWLRWLGYCLTGSVAEEKAFMMYGPGGNGKGTLTKLLMTLFNDYACSLPVSAVCECSRMQDAGAATTELNGLEKSRLAIVEELPQGRKLDTAKFKRITGGDKIPIRRLYEEFTLIEPTHKIIISGNYRPELTDAHDDGLIRRIKNVDFLQSFTGERRDPHLKEKLLNPDALSGLLSLLVDEAVAWYKHGLIFSPAMEQSTKGYFNQFDFLGEFISEFCEYGSGKFIEINGFVKRLREEYPDETAIISDRNLKDMIKRLAGKDGVEYRRVGAKSRYGLAGIGFRNDDDWHGECVNPNTTAIPK